MIGDMKTTGIITMKIMKICVFVALLPLLACSAGNNPVVKNGADTTSVDTTASITLLFAGDMMQHDGQIKAARCADGTYDYSEYFSYVTSEIEEADVAIANFEVTLGGAPYKGYPCFSAPDEYAKAIKDAGFDILLTNNNHSCDTGARGLGRTIGMLDSLGVPHLGTYVNQEARQKQYPYLLEKNGFRIALLSYTYGTNGLPIPEPYIVNTIDTVQIKKDIKAAQAMKPDAIIAFMHWGTEYVLKPVASQKWQADWLLRNGVTHVIGGHPHVVEPIEIRKDNNGDRHMVVWSLGNYVSNMTKPNTYGGLMVRLQLEKDSSVRVKDCDYSLIWTSRPAVSGHKTHRVYPASIDPSLLNPAERQQLKSFVTTTRKLFETNNIGISERK